MARKQETPFDKIISTKQTLGLYLEFGEAALRGATVEDLIRDASECLDTLMTFRNIINGMVGLKEEPAKAVLPYIE